jgi:NlpC/P60 family putative phage cell wall peptidase
MTAVLSRADVVRAARRWIGTPYHHQASLKGVGTDCIGLVRGVWAELYGDEAETPPGYSRDWAEASGEETLLAAARRHLVEIEARDLRGGDIAVFRYRANVVAKHVGIVAVRCIAERAVPTLIHAVEGAPVVEVELGAWWRRRIAGAFRFPGIKD